MTSTVDAPTGSSAGSIRINSRYGSWLASSTSPSSSLRENHGDTQTAPSLYPQPSSTLSVTQTSLSTPSTSQTLTMGYSSSPKPSHSSLEIVLPSDKVFVKGVGSMAEPGLLTGHLVLKLAESTSIKEIKLEMRGKAKLPAVSNDSPRLQSNNSITSVVYAHDWNFLAGEHRSAHTLKAGQHVLPFQVEIGAHVPSSLETHNASLGISYKLQATAVKSGIVSNSFTAQRRLYILRSLALEALEYQQTLEIENTWPEKIMYSISIPHKAWAAGDTVCALVKFSPLRKGISIKSVVSKISETTKVSYPYGTVENSRVVASIKHAFGPDGKPQPVDTYKVQPSSKSQGGMFHVGDVQKSNTVPGSYPTPPVTSRSLSGLPVEDTATIGLSRMPSRANSLSEVPRRLNSGEEDCSVQGDHDIVALLPVTLPTTLVPSHSAEPINIHYRIRWVVGVLNPDGHVSELRCSLPIMILDHSLLTEARLATNETRRLLFGSASNEGRVGVDKDIELPSYDNHVLDRVANSFFPSSTSRVNNVWIMEGMNSARYNEAPQPLPSSLSSGPSTPYSESESALEWINNELMSSLGESWRVKQTRCRWKSGSESETNSRRSSRPSSRASSPERGIYTHSPQYGRSTPSLTTSSASSSTSSTSSSSSSKQSLFNRTLRPFTSITSRSPPLPTPPPPSAPVQPVPLRTEPAPPNHEAVVMSAFSEVPDYDIATRGFLGGGIPPLESMRGLPSYEDSERRQR